MTDDSWHDRFVSGIRMGLSFDSAATRCGQYFQTVVRHLGDDKAFRLAVIAAREEAEAQVQALLDRSA